jgi:hypothetical protein
MAAYAELQPAADGSHPVLRIDLPHAILRAAAIRPDDGWHTLLVQAVRHLRPPGAAAFLAGLEGDGRRATVTFSLPARQEGEPPAEIVRWLGDTDAAAA